MKAIPFFLLACISINLIGAAKQCTPEPPAVCNEDVCCRTYCLGPENYGVNAAVRPRTCNGDWVITVAGFYWKTSQGGMEYAVDTKVKTEGNALDTNDYNRISIIDAEYLNPNFHWNWGFKAGIGYNTTCDGWDVGILWTQYHGKASSHDEAELDDNHTLLPIWTNFANGTSSNSFLPTFANDIETFWKLNLDLVDLELGREFWNSKRLALRPHVGLRYARINQKYELQHKGGSWSQVVTNPPSIISKIQNNEVDIDNNFKGIGIRAGLDSVWNFGCGWALYENTALSLLYGRFHVNHNEMNRDAVSPFTKNTFFEANENLHSSQFVLDLFLGIQWSALFCDCKYGFTVKFGWENHIFFDQNQMWRVTKTYDILNAFNGPVFFTNDFSQCRGNLRTQGWTLTFVFDF